MVQRALGVATTVTLALSPWDTRPGRFVTRTAASAEDAKSPARTTAVTSIVMCRTPRIITIYDTTAKR